MTKLPQNRSDVTIQDREGNTAVMHAVKYGSSSILRTFVEYFVAFGVDPNFLRQRNVYGKTALEMAKESGKSDCVHALTNFVTHNFELPFEWRPINTTESKSTQDSESSPVKQDTRPLTRRKPVPEKRKDNNARRSSEEQEMKRKGELTSKPKNTLQPKSEVFQEIWEQETRNWFNGDSSKATNGCKSAKSNDSVEKCDEFKLPPINSGKLIDYKTWCEMGENTGRRSSSFAVQSTS
ncbi:hypothetical protein B4U80_06567 [Leptotrombidium deliense]|uniref:Uncharacterized protein n=1 Tax=Leptotrombidium deliense TaxID=299467 RepID=A0A443SQE2_9ACAR|nr:hypothetical protein B4U80_06567 [Leptotrombidium deliense]